MQKILYIKKVGIQRREKPTMTLFETSKFLISTPLDVVEDKNCGDVPTEEDEARDNQIYQVEALAAELSHSAPNARYSTLQSVASEIVEGKITHKEGITRLTSKKVVIKKKWVKNF